ncbi:MAG TPA: 30S ribosomal protein S9 [Candidatus Paceibacterota bacterium]
MQTTSDTVRYNEGVGKRKSAIARVRVTKAIKPSFEVNNRPSEEYFPGEIFAGIIREPLRASGSPNKYKVTVRVVGGGVMAQAEATRLGLAKALIGDDLTLRGPIKKARLLTRDSRIKERRKFGLKKARKAPQWSKR